MLKNETIAQDLAWRIILGYGIEIIDSKKLIGTDLEEGNSTDRIVAKSPDGRIVWYVFPSRESAQLTYDRAIQIIKLLKDRKWSELPLLCKTN